MTSLSERSPEVRPGLLTVALAVAFALVASAVASILVDKYSLRFHQIGESHIGHIVVSTVSKGVTIIAKRVAIIAPPLQPACNGLNHAKPTSFFVFLNFVEI